MSKKNQEEAKKKAQTALSVSSSGRIQLDSKGRLIPSDHIRGVGSGSAYNKSTSFTADKKSAEDLNKYLKKTGYSLTGGDGRVVVGHKTINTPPASFANNYGGAYYPSRKETVAIYGPAATSQPEVRRGGSGSSSSGGTRTTSSGSTPSAVTRTRQYAENRIYGRVPEGRKPDMFPQGVPVEGRAPEAVADYTDRLDTYNQNLQGWMNDRAVASQYESGEFLRNFAAGLPKAPDIMSTDEMFRTARRFSEVEYG
jgi:hypothetical protein